MKRSKLNYTNIGVRGRRTGVKLPEGVSADDTIDQVDRVFDEINAEPDTSSFIDLHFDKKNISNLQEDDFLIASRKEDISFRADPDESFFFPDSSSLGSKTRLSSSPSTSNKRSPNSKTKSKTKSPKVIHHIQTSESSQPELEDQFDQLSVVNFDEEDMMDSTPPEFYSNLTQSLKSNLPSTPTKSYKSSKSSKSPVSGKQKSPANSSRKSPSSTTLQSPVVKKLKANDSTYNETTDSRSPNKKANINGKSSPKKDKTLKETNKSQHTKPIVVKPKKILPNQTKLKDKKITTKPSNPPTSRISDNDEMPLGARRSQRQRVQPLKFWENERLVYTLEKTENGRVPVLKEVVTSQENDQPIQNKKKTTRKVSKPTTSKTNSAQSQDLVSFYHSLNDKRRLIKPPKAIVEDYNTNTFVAKEIVFPFHSIQFDSVIENHQFKPAYKEDGLFLTGMLSICPGGEKDMRMSNHRFLTFFVIYGKVEVTVAQNEFTIQSGDHFVVPKDNIYKIKNLTREECRLFFTICQDSSTTLNSPTSDNS